ncbi:hypothetical protein LTR62_002058 [Meristemomyces frigidus]|uniref:Uncharacterized protein n=1 Tax=Meristemomyces frigidus TaxID=1508187 RepID=A0AAN7TFY1_9PEZI|nr:hypothetical protein LTR62_002058 [Meristemomyces frigidus]
MASPGLICPVGYAKACSQTAGGTATGIGRMQFSLIPSETAVGCCPSGFNCVINGNNVQTCTSIVASYETVELASCVSSSFGSTTNLGIPAAETVSSEVSSLTELVVQAPMIDIRWRPQDLTAAGMGTLTSLSAAATNSGTSSGSTSSATVTPAPGLDTSAEIAIGVTIPVVVLALLAAVFAFWRRRRRVQRRLPAGEVAYQYEVVKGHSEDAAPAELRGRPLYEMEYLPAAQEMEGRTSQGGERHELAGDDPK